MADEIIEVNSDEDWDKIPAEKRTYDVIHQVYLRVTADSQDEVEAILFEDLEVSSTNVNIYFCGEETEFLYEDEDDD